MGVTVSALLAQSCSKCYLLGSGASIGTGYIAPRNMVLKDFVIWKRPFFSCDLNLFLGITGISSSTYEYCILLLLCANEGIQRHVFIFT